MPYHLQQRRDAPLWREVREMPVPVYSCEKKQRCPQHILQPVLQRAVDGRPCVTSKYHTVLIHFEQQDDHVLATLRDVSTHAETRVRARYLVACDGVTSGVRETLGIPMQGTPKLSYSVGITARIPDFLAYSHYGQAERFIFIGPEGTWGNLTTVDGRDLWRLTLLSAEDKLDLHSLDPVAWVRRALGRKDAPVEITAVLPWRRREQTAAMRRGFGLIEARRECTARAEEAGVHERHDAPEIERAVLERRAGQCDTMPRLELKRGTRDRRRRVLDLLRFIEDHAVDRLAELSQLSDRQLADIGIKRSDIPRVVVGEPIDGYRIRVPGLKGWTPSTASNDWTGSAAA